MTTHWQSPDIDPQFELWPTVPGLALDDIRGQVPPAWFEALKPLWDLDLTVWFCSEKSNGGLLVRYQPAIEGGSRAGLAEADALVAKASRLCGACGQPGRPARLDRRRVACARCAAAVRAGNSWAECIARHFDKMGHRIDSARPSHRASTDKPLARHLELTPIAEQPKEMAPATWERDQVFAARRLLSEALRERIVGDGLISRLSTIGAQWLANRRHTVITLIGPTGTGKTAVARALSEALKRVALGMGAGSRPVIPSVVVDLQELSEGSAWWGRSLADEVLALYQEAGSDLTLAEAGAVIVLDGMDSMAFRRRTGSGREFTRSKQTSVLPVLSGANVPFSSQGSEHARDSFSCAHSLVIMTARLDSLEPEPPPATPPAPIDIQRQGYSPELVSRLGTLMVMPALTDGEQRELLAQLLARESDAWKDWGYLLKVSKQAVGLVSSLLQGQRLGLAIPSAAALLQTAAREKLEELVAEDAAEGTEWLLTPDAVRLPDVKTKPGWRG